jgi:hypothetical protein
VSADFRRHSVSDGGADDSIRRRGAYWLAAILTVLVLFFRPLLKPSALRNPNEERLIIVGWVVVVGMAIEFGAANSAGWFWLFGWLVVIVAGTVLSHDVSDSPAAKHDGIEHSS